MSLERLSLFVSSLIHPIQSWRTAMITAQERRDLIFETAYERLDLQVITEMREYFGYRLTTAAADVFLRRLFEQRYLNCVYGCWCATSVLKAVRALPVSIQCADRVVCEMLHREALHRADWIETSQILREISTMTVFPPAYRAEAIKYGILEDPGLWRDETLWFYDSLKLLKMEAPELLGTMPQQLLRTAQNKGDLKFAERIAQTFFGRALTRIEKKAGLHLGNGFDIADKQLRTLKAV